MSSSLGQAEFSIGSTRAGEFRVRALEAPPAIGHRLLVSVDCVAHDLGASDRSREPAVEGYRLIGLVGELRLDRETHPLCALHWLGAGHWLKSVDYVQPHPLQLVADLDAGRVENLAEHATEQGLTLFLQLWPTFVKADHELRAKADLIRLAVPITTWAGLAREWRGEQHDVLLVRSPLIHAGRFRASLEAMKKADQLIDQARYGEAVAKCRVALERLAQETEETTGEASVRAALNELVGEKKSEAYTGLLTQLKKLGNLEVHGSGEAGFSRSEALFVVRCTKSLLEVYGSILSD